MDPSKESDRTPFGVTDSQAQGQKRGRPGRKRLKMIMIVALIITILIVIIVVPIVVIGDRKRARAFARRTPQTMSAASDQYCSRADNVSLCKSTVMQGVNDDTPFRTADLPGLAIKIINATKGPMDVILSAMPVLKQKSNMSLAAAEACNRSLYDGPESLEEAAGLISSGHIRDAQIVLASVRTFDTDCADQLLLLENLPGSASTPLAEALPATELVAFHLANALALTNEILADARGEKLSGRRRKLMRRRLLAEADKVRRGMDADFTVGSNGTGALRNLTSAISQALSKRATTKERIVIRVLAGVYNEQLLIPKDLWGLTLIGEGAERTRISHHDFGDSGGTSGASSFAVEARGFLAIDLTFANDALKNDRHRPAVAMRVSQRASANSGTAHIVPGNAGMAAFVSCKFQGYHGVLYAHTGWQFYYDCDIKGSEDYIFGNAGAVFEQCTIHSQLDFNGTSVITAQGRTSAHEPTGFVFRKCGVEGELETNSSVFLGEPQPYQKVFLRPAWKPFSRTALLLSVLGRVEPAGWLEWRYAAGDANLYKTVEFYEHDNSGPGSGRSARVRWSQELGEEDVKLYTVDRFISGDIWLPPLGIPSAMWL